MKPPDEVATNHVPLGADALNRLSHAGWVVTVSTMIGFDGLIHWIAAGVRDDALIRADGATRDEALICAVEQARSLGMLNGGS